MTRKTMLKLNIAIVFSIIAILTGCGTVDNMNNNASSSTSSSTVSYTHLDKFSSLNVNDFKQDKTLQSIEITGNLPNPSEIQDEFYNDSEIKASEESINENETPEDEPDIDFSDIGTDSEIVKEVIKELYTTYNYNSHEVLSIYESEIPEMDGYEYSLALKFDTGDIYVVYKNGDKAYAIKDEYGVY